MTSFDTHAEQTRALLLDRLSKRLTRVEGGDFDGVRVVTAAMLTEEFGEELPDFGDPHGATVTTPARVNVRDVCPRCDDVVHVTLTVDSHLDVTPKASKLGLHTASKPAHHSCGRDELPEGVVAGQLGLDQAPHCCCAIGGNDPTTGANVCKTTECPVHATEAHAPLVAVHEDFDDGTEPGAEDEDAEGDAIHRLHAVPAPNAGDEDPDALLPEPEAAEPTRRRR